MTSERGSTSSPCDSRRVGLPSRGFLGMAGDDTSGSDIIHELSGWRHSELLDSNSAGTYHEDTHGWSPYASKSTKFSCHIQISGRGNRHILARRPIPLSPPQSVDQLMPTAWCIRELRPEDVTRQLAYPNDAVGFSGIKICDINISTSATEVLRRASC